MSSGSVGRTPPRNDWVDSTFWVGLAHLGARFAGPDRLQFLYQDHPDSTSHRLTHIDRLLAARQLRASMCPVDTLDVTDRLSRTEGSQ